MIKLLYNPRVDKVFFHSLTWRAIIPLLLCIVVCIFCLVVFPFLWSCASYCWWTWQRTWRSLWRISGNNKVKLYIYCFLFSFEFSKNMFQLLVKQHYSHCTFISPSMFTSCFSSWVKWPLNSMFQSVSLSWPSLRIYWKIKTLWRTDVFVLFDCHLNV